VDALKGGLLVSGSTCKGALVMEKDVDAYSGGVADMAEGVERWGREKD